MTDPAAWVTALRDRWAPGRRTLGGWCTVGNSFSAELMGRAGFDWVCVDQHHGLVGPDPLVPMVQALALTGTPALVRVPSNEAAAIMRALDAGAQGVIVPLVEDADGARAAVSAARYSPDGARSWGPARPIHEAPGYTPELGNRRTVVVVQVESLRAVELLDVILDVPGIDGIFVGPNDLALSGGWPPTLRPGPGPHREAILRILDGGQRRGIVTGIYAGSVEAALDWIGEGFGMIGVISDALLIRGGAGSALERLRADT